MPAAGPLKHPVHVFLRSAWYSFAHIYLNSCGNFIRKLREMLASISLPAYASRLKMPFLVHEYVLLQQDTGLSEKLLTGLMLAKMQVMTDVAESIYEWYSMYLALELWLLILVLITAATKLPILFSLTSHKCCRRHVCLHFSTQFPRMIVFRRICVCAAVESFLLYKIVLPGG